MSPSRLSFLDCYTHTIRCFDLRGREITSIMVLGGVCAIIDHPGDLIPLARLKMTAARLGKEIPPEPHWAFAYRMLYKVSRSFSIVIHELPTELRNPICVFYLILRALDTVEDDTSIPSEVKVPILQSFHQHIYDKNWHFSCGTKDYKVLMDKLHLVSTAFLELDKSFQEVIEDTTKKMGEGMAKFICQEHSRLQVETLKDYDEYCYYVAGLVGEGVTKLTHSCGLEDLTSVRGTISMGLFLQKTNIIRDYLEDINEIPKSRMFWPREIWSKYANKLEYEENSIKAVECLNELITNALMHVEGCLQYMSKLRNPSIIHSFAIPQIMGIGTLALCYNNIEVFRGVVKMRRGLTAQIFDQTRSMSDIYSAFFDFSCMLKDKVEMNDPNAELTLKCIENIQNACINSGMLKKRRYYGGGSRRFLLLLITFLLALISILIASFMKKGTVPFW